MASAKNMLSPHAVPFSPSGQNIQNNRPGQGDPLVTPMKMCTDNGVTPSKNSAFKKVASTEAFTKITFRVNHPPSRPQVDDVGVCMNVIGSIRALGSWDHARGKRMTRTVDGHWELNVYVPSSVEFLYQYVLKDLDDGEVVWESSLERKLCATQSADLSLLQLDDTISHQEGAANGKAVKDENPEALDSSFKESFFAPDPLLAVQWGSGEEDDESRDSILPAPTFSCTKMKTRSTPARVSMGTDRAFADCEQAATVNGKRMSRIMKSPSSTASPHSGVAVTTPTQGQEPSNLIDWVSQTLTALNIPAEWLSPSASKHQNKAEQALHALSSRLQEANSKVHTLLEEKAQVESEAQALREALEGLDSGAAKERMAAEEAKRELEQDRQEQQMKSRRFRAALRANEGKFRSAKEGLLSLKIEMTTMQSQCSHTLKELAEELSSGIEQITRGTADELEETKRKLLKEAVERRRLHNQVLELKGNIRVFCRVRPLSSKEEKEGRKVSMLFPSDQELAVATGGGKYTPYTYDAVFAPQATNEQVYEETRPLITSALDGYNICVFAYGQTGSGKTYTMQGINTRAISDLFATAEERRVVAKYEFRVSAIEIYNEVIKDLIEPNDEAGKPKKLEVKTDAATGASCVPEMRQEAVGSTEDVVRIMDAAMRNRSTSSTSMNEHSSRSHLIITIHMTKCDLVNGGTAFGKMHLIDLAGSERLSRTAAEGDRLTEAKHINKSLSALGNCVSSLLSKSKHTPYRDSKLTFLLQDSLGQDSKTLMFVCTSPADSDVPETTCSLQFASRVSKVELGVAKKKTDGGAGAMLKEADSKMQAAASQVRRAEEQLQRATEQVSTEAEERARVEKRVQELERELKQRTDELRARADGDAEKERGLRVGAERALAERERALGERERRLTALQGELEEQERSISLSRASISRERESVLSQHTLYQSSRDMSREGAAARARESASSQESLARSDAPPIAPEDSASSFLAAEARATAAVQHVTATHVTTTTVHVTTNAAHVTASAAHVTASPAKAPRSPEKGGGELRSSIPPPVVRGLLSPPPKPARAGGEEGGGAHAPLTEGKENAAKGDAAGGGGGGSPKVDRSAQSLEERLALFRARKEEARKRQEAASQSQSHKIKSPLKSTQTKHAPVSTPALKRTNAFGTSGKGPSPSPLSSGAERIPQAKTATRVGTSSALRPKTAPATGSRAARPTASSGWR